MAKSIVTADLERPMRCRVSMQDMGVYTLLNTTRTPVRLTSSSLVEEFLDATRTAAASCPAV